MENKITPESINTLSIDQKEENFLKELEDIKSSNIKYNPDYLEVEEIHPNLLQGLIVPNGPVWVGIDGEMCRAMMKEVKLPDTYEPAWLGLVSYDYQLIHICVNFAKSLNWKYLYAILKTNDKIHIRGC